MANYARTKLIVVVVLISSNSLTLPLNSSISASFFLFSGFKSFRDGNAVKSQKMMRARVVAQGVTVTLMMGYAFYNQLYLDKPKEKEIDRDELIKYFF